MQAEAQVKWVILEQWIAPVSRAAQGGGLREFLS